MMDDNSFGAVRSMVSTEGNWPVVTPGVVFLIDRLYVRTSGRSERTGAQASRLQLPHTVLVGVQARTLALRSGRWSPVGTPIAQTLLAGACNGLPRRIAPKVPWRKVWVVLFTRAVLEALAEAKPTRDT